MARGEMPIEPGDSWFSPKCMEVQPSRSGARAPTSAWEVGHWMGSGPGAGYQPQPNRECPGERVRRVRQPGLTLVAERETTQTAG